MTKDARDKLGMFFKKSTMQQDRTFRHDGLPAHYGYLTITQVSTNTIVGTITEDKLITRKMGFTPFELVRLKKLLKDFDMRLLTWKEEKCQP